MKRSQNPAVWLGATCVMMVLMVVLVLAFTRRPRRPHEADAGPSVGDLGAQPQAPGPCPLPTQVPPRTVTDCDFIASPSTNTACPWHFERWDLAHCGPSTAPPAPATSPCAPFPTGERLASGRLVAGGRCAGLYAVSWNRTQPPVDPVPPRPRHDSAVGPGPGPGGRTATPGPTTVNVQICENGNCQAAPSTNAQLHPGD